ncbi:MAG: DUF4276 family protein [Candidatus Desantisbacteria bacterium]
MNRKASPPVGIIAEDDSDIDSVRVLIHRISGNDKIKVHKFIGKGCGKINRKCHAWADQLNKKGCSTLILIHDLDTNKPIELDKKIREALKHCPIINHLICIPVQELEAWFLSDPEAIKTSLNLRKEPVVKGLPENISSPKEYLGQLIDTASGGERIYLNTKHNVKIVEVLTIEKVKDRCPSFIPFYDFIRKYL